MKWHEAMLGGYPLLFDDRYFIPQHIVICQIFFPYVVYSRVYPRFTPSEILRDWHRQDDS
jgi:hypothetical protein